MTGPIAARLPGDRLHLQHGPIDLVIGADGGRETAFGAAAARFETILEELVAERDLLHRPNFSRVSKYPGGARGAEPPIRRAAAATAPQGETARLMCAAVAPFTEFVTPMAAVAGAVAETILAAMIGAASLTRAYVNNGGDIALHLAPGRGFRAALAGLDGTARGVAEIRAETAVRGIATSGRGGRSLSMGIADSVTVLAGSAARADAAATLIANAVDLPGHAAIRRSPARDLQPDSDLGARAVVTQCGALTTDEIAAALDRGAARAGAMRAAGQIETAALFLRGQSRIVGPLALEERTLTHA